MNISLSDQNVNHECLLCGYEATYKSGSKDNNLVYLFKCPVCTEFILSHSFYTRFRNVPSQIENRHILSGLARNIWEKYEIRLEISAQNYMDLIKGQDTRVVIPRTPPEKADLILSYIQMKSKGDFGTIRIDALTEYTSCFTENPSDFVAYMEHLNDLGFIKLKNTGARELAVSLKMAGWEHLRKTNIESDRCFIAMNFHEDFKPLYEDGIEQAVLDAGWHPVLIGDFAKEHPKPDMTLDAQIISEIKKARFLIADFTLQRQSVYYEAGFAKGLGIPVIYCCRKSDMEELHFDIRNYLHLGWNDELPKFRDELKSMILAVVGEGNYKPTL